MHVEIWQCKKDSEIIYMNYEFANRTANLRNYMKYYNKIYEYEEDRYSSTPERIILELISQRFKRNVPADFKGHGITVSDLIMLDDKIFFVDTFGFQPIY